MVWGDGQLAFFACILSPMNLYFSCSLTGGRDDQPVYAALVGYLLAQGHTVPTAHLAHPGVMKEEAQKFLDVISKPTVVSPWARRRVSGPVGEILRFAQNDK